jgi:hypothetical protein
VKEVEKWTDELEAEPPTFLVLCNKFYVNGRQQGNKKGYCGRSCTSTLGERLSVNNLGQYDILLMNLVSVKLTYIRSCPV